MINRQFFGLELAHIYLHDTVYTGVTQTSSLSPTSGRAGFQGDTKETR